MIMMYLTKEELVKNIAEQTERAFAIIEHIDFDSDKLNPNTVIIPFLSNIADSALIVMALEENSDRENDCHRNAYNLVMCSLKVKNTTKDFIRKIQDFRQKYTSGKQDILFDSAECLDFLNAYDCFMFEFTKNSTTVQQMKVLKFSSFRNMTEKLLKKNAVTESGDIQANELLKQFIRSNSLLEELIAENQKINNRLDDIKKSIDNLENIIKSIDNGGKL